MACMHSRPLHKECLKKYLTPQPCTSLAYQTLKQHGYTVHSMHHVSSHRGRSGHRLKPIQATDNKNPQQQQDSRQQAPPTPASTSKSQQAPISPPLPQQLQQQLQAVLSWVQRRWAQLTLPQRVYTVVAGLALLAALPKLLTLLVLLLERALIGGLLVIEEVLLDLLLKGGALLGIIAVVALLGAGVYVFTQKATK